ncbi:thioredoxin fold domain-containing protein [Butyricimonas sp.]|uniref:thioredoxin fold domain-containing protein n=1 Tax=Butyricimonas sp. TaxID=1969738 RepID=UPI0025BAD51D|nr:thioredoxin fold domain-containing protein [Butyricimonas sp.]
MKKNSRIGTWLSVVLLLVMFGLSVKAQKYKSVFKDLTWEQAAELAQKEGKIVLVDAMMKARTPEDRKKRDEAERKLFSVPGIMDFCNRNIVAIHIDMGTEAGKAFAPKLVMNMYPTYGFFMPDGDILGVVSPFILAQKPEVFLEKGQKAVKEAEVKRSNKRSILFEEIGFKEALVKAKKEKKLIFIDAYTDYCQPCVMMVKNIFSLDKVADFYNENFINLKLDFGKEKELAQKYGTSGYPAFVFVNGDGKLVYLAGGYTEAEPFIGYGQEALKKAQGIEFTAGSWNEILAKAKQENKLIFMDCYTSWCGPCKQMAQTTFVDPDVAALFNEKFINVKVDMEKGEGKELSKRYGVRAYPTLNFIHGDGEIVHCVVGGLGADELIRQGKLVLEGKGLSYMQNEYADGNREPEFITSYLEVLGMANLGEDAQKVTLEYFATLDREKLNEKKYWDIFVRNVNDVDSDLFRYVYANREHLVSLYGEQQVNRKIQSVWATGANRFVQEKEGAKVLDKKGFERYVKRMKKAKVDGWEDIAANARMNNAEKTGDWKTYVTEGDALLKNGKVSDLLLYNWGLRITKNCKDKELRARAARWFENAAAESAKKEAEGKAGMMSYRTYFEKLAAELK